MKAELLLTNDGSVIFACEEALKVNLNSVEFYRDNGAFVFNFDEANQNGDQSVMLDMELGSEYHDIIMSSSMVLVTWFDVSNQRQTFYVPFIHVG